MISRAGRPVPLEPRGIADGLRALRLTVLAFLVLDTISTLLGPSYGVQGLGPSNLRAATQMVLSTAAAAATMWHRLRSALVLCGLVAVLAVAVGGRGSEPWLLLTTSVVGAARVRRRAQAVGLAGCYLAFAGAFAASSEARSPGGGWANLALALGIPAVGSLAGLLARRLVRAGELSTARVRQLEQENEQIRAVERGRLADDLQSVVTGGLAAISARVDAVSGSQATSVLREALLDIDARSRALLDELRTLLAVLRRDGAAGVPAPSPAGAEGRVRPRVLTARNFRMGVTALCSALAIQAVVGQGGPSSVEDLAVKVLGLAACAAAVWRPTLGTGCAGVALLVSFATGSDQVWSLLPPVLLCLLATLRVRPRRVWLVALALASYCVVLGLVDPADLLDRVLRVGYLGFIAIAVGMAARHFAESHRESVRRHTDLLHTRERVGHEERNAVARELHDVVAHQISITTMLVMATTGSDDPVELDDAVVRVGACVETAREELTTLLQAMRRPAADELRPTPLVAPSASAAALARQLVENGHHPVLDVDPAADAVDPTSQRTLARVMQEGTTNILRYAPPGSGCDYRLTVLDGVVRLSISSPLARGRSSSELSLGWGLRGARERVSLTGGTFSAGPRRNRWVITLTLPTASAAPASMSGTGGRATR